jgi:hypothetical protein
VRRARTTIPQAATPAGLRGPQAAAAKTPAPRPRPLALAALPPLPQPPGASPLAGVDPNQCRAACARTYYFCLAGENAEACPEPWTRCVVDCTHPPIGAR